MATKTIKSHDESSTGIQVKDDSLQLTTATDGDTNGLLINKSGTYIRGKLSMMTTPEDVRWGGLWVEQSGWMQMMPPTMAFPYPRFKLAPSFAGIAGMIKDFTLIAGFYI